MTGPQIDKRGLQITVRAAARAACSPCLFF